SSALGMPPLAVDPLRRAECRYLMHISDPKMARFLKGGPAGIPCTKFYPMEQHAARRRASSPGVAEGGMPQAHVIDGADVVSLRDGPGKGPRKVMLGATDGVTDQWK